MVKKEFQGKKLYDFEFPVEGGKIREFANAILDKSLIYSDYNYASSKGFSGVPMPPTFPVTNGFHIESDNYVMELTLKLGMNVATSVHGETEFIYERLVCAGETLRGEIHVGKIYEKKNDKGKVMTFVEMQNLFFDKNDKLVITVKNLFIER
jgi:hypothetical protein